MVEVSCRACDADATIVHRIEAAGPAPLIDLVRYAGRDADVAYLDVIIIDEPALARPLLEGRVRGGIVCWPFNSKSGPVRSWILT